MKFQKPLNEVFKNLSHVKVLRVLTTSELDLTGNEIARLAGISPLGCKNALDNLRDLNLLAVRKVGRANLYRLREDNLIVKKILRQLFTEEKNFLEEELRKVAENFSSFAHSVYLFGSVARGEETFQSDIDLCVITSDPNCLEQAKEKAMEMTDLLNRETGITPNILVMDKVDFMQRYKADDDLAKNIIEEGTILFGTRDFT